MPETLNQLTLPEISPATDKDILAYLRRSCQLAEIATTAERDALILSMCEQLGITVSDEELQAAGDAFRLEHKIPGASETLAWLARQRINVEDWSQGIRLSLLSLKLKEHLFSEAIDNHYINNRDDYRRVALSQISVRDFTKAEKIAQALREEDASFCALAIEYSQGKQSKENGGFMGIRFLMNLLPEVAEAISNSKEGEIIGPVETTQGYYILRVEKWFPSELSEVREQVLEFTFDLWLQANANKISPNEKS